MSTLTPVKIPVDVLHRIVVLVVAKLCGLAVSASSVVTPGFWCWWSYRWTFCIVSSSWSSTKLLWTRCVRVVSRHPGVPTLVKLPRNVLCCLRPWTCCSSRRELRRRRTAYRSFFYVFLFFLFFPFFAGCK